MKPKVLFVVILALILTGCGSSAQKGQYKGSDPGVEFYITDAGVEQFYFSKLVVSNNQTFDCYLMFGVPNDLTQNVPIDLMGSFSYTQNRNDNAVNFLNGKVNGDTVAGEYSFEKCGVASGMLDISINFAPPLTGKWSAKLIKP